MFKLKQISKSSIPEALEKAERYRLLNEPWMAESICFDILEAEPENKKAIIILLLSITDEFGSSPMVDVNEAKKLLARLPEEYDRLYYAGLICERQGKSVLKRDIPEGGFIAFEWLSEAMEYYEKAEAVRSAGNDDAILRWNTCARMIMRHHLEPRNERYVEAPLE
jgi:hypothetical protein